ncbi:hypothetical protein CSC12_4091 [Klebsiella michiganensis]|nr:hypothetical protein CSC12_4091 [Klebsiella michiganensis]
MNYSGFLFFMSGKKAGDINDDKISTASTQLTQLSSLHCFLLIGSA